VSDAQKEYARFEELSEYIVKHIFKNTNAVIKRTQPTKDGGYDIVAECNNEQISQKVYFECKLRNKNLNLRDIAANVIIAFNEGAVALVAFINHDYTVQVDEQFSHFIKKTALKIKIIMGDDINLLIHKYNIPLSDKLSKLITTTRSRRKTIDSLLQIDFSKENLHEQILCKMQPCTRTSDFGFIPKQQKAKIFGAKTILQQGGLLVVSGFLGIGKHTFVESVISELGYIRISIDASLHITQERALLDILFNIWGISASNIIEDFTDTHIDMIIERLNNRIKNKKTLNILRRIFGDKRIQGINDEDYNKLICDYIVNLAELHKENVKFLFVFENLSFANDGNKILLSYLIKQLSRSRIPCIIIHDTEEYFIQESFDLHKEFGFLLNFSIFKLNAYTNDEAIDYILTQYPEIPMFIVKKIIEQVGTRKANISMFLEYIQTIGISMTDNIHIAHELQTIQPNALLTITNRILECYRQQDASVLLFDMLFLLHGKISEQLCDKLKIDNCLLEQFTKMNILVYHQGYYACSNRIVQTIIDDFGTENSPRLGQLSLKILKIWETQPDIDTSDAKAYLLHYAGKYKDALAVLLPYINYLESERQFDALIVSSDLAINLYRKINDPIEWMKWTIYQLKIFDIKKNIFLPKATIRMKELSDDLTRYLYLNVPDYYSQAYDYFVFTADFKNGLYDTYAKNGLKMRRYFDDAVSGVNIRNYDDWLGSICNRYVLCIKESEGYDAALNAYINIINVLPDSVRIWRGYQSHLACMCLYTAPNEAYNYYEKLIMNSHKSKILYSLPFHEYVDRAMSKLFAGDLALAESFARYAIDICEANGILDEWGRSLNILGCVLVCQNKLVEAKSIFKESMEMLKISGYKLFRWRSQLNYIHTALKNGDDPKPLSIELEDAYRCFSSLLKEKVIVLLQKNTEEVVQSRDYHALLAFGLYNSKICNSTENIILTDFEFGCHQNRYQSDLQALKNNPSSALPNSPFFRSGMIMVVG
jgi:hypothetical protein